MVKIAAKSGEWPSWVTPDLVSGEYLSFSELKTVRNWIFWQETRPEENGRAVIAGRSPDGVIHDLIPPDYTVGSRVHEYGGGAWDVRLDGDSPEVAFSDRKSGRLCFVGKDKVTVICEEKGQPEKRYADLFWDVAGSGVFCVRETHGEGFPTASIVHVSKEGQEVLLAEGADFYAAPRQSEDGKNLAWFCWNNPEMPWTNTRLEIASYNSANKKIGEVTTLDSEISCSIIEPKWADNGRLYATSDERGNWSPLYFTQDKTGWKKNWLPDPNAEIGLPHWIFGQRTYSPLPDGSLIALGIRKGISDVLLLKNENWEEKTMGRPGSVPERLDDGRFSWIDTPENSPPSLVIGSLDGNFEKFRSSIILPDDVTDKDISCPELFSFSTTNNATSYALFYRPASQTFCLPNGELPPLVVMAHGGPTGRANGAFAFKVQWWTSRGFAVLDVNYRGSTGFGKEYRKALDGRWGVIDVEDCLSGTKALVDHGIVDPKRCVIRGSSAGGLTVLLALAKSNYFVGGSSLYGVTDLRALSEETHKFEAQYLEILIGPYLEGENIYLERSPIGCAKTINAPILFLHGELDRVVPLSQAREMCSKLQNSEIHTYPEEGHGFRRKETIKDALIKELLFYQKIFKNM